jgi:hypothetical protein
MARTAGHPDNGVANLTRGGAQGTCLVGYAGAPFSLPSERGRSSFTSAAIMMFVMPPREHRHRPDRAPVGCRSPPGFVEPVAGTTSASGDEDAAQVVDFTTACRGSSEAEQLIRNQ